MTLASSQDLMYSIPGGENPLLAKELESESVCQQPFLAYFADFVLGGEVELQGCSIAKEVSLGCGG
jgi:hypothetical protein